MLPILLGHFLAFAFTLFCAINTTVIVIIMSPLILGKAFLNNTRWSTHLSTKMRDLATIWMWNNNFFLGLYQKVEWDVQIPDGLDLNKSYLLISNHQKWVDIFVLFRVFLYKIPFPMFFIKQKLIWFPIIGLAWWGLDYPFMKRYSKSYLEKYPEKRGKDLETTKRICEKFREVPVTMINFLEGTRYTAAKAKKQNTPYHHLLLPRAGGVALVLATMGDFIDANLNVTIAYSKPELNYWNFVGGYAQKIVVRVEMLEIPQGFVKGDYQNDAAFQKEFQDWLNEQWKVKDKLIQTVNETF